MLRQVRLVHEQLRPLLERLAGVLPVADLREAEERVRHGEPGLALELVCTQLHEYGVRGRPRSDRPDDERSGVLAAVAVEARRTT